MGVMPKPAAPVYRTTNWTEYNAALKRRGSLEIWFDPEMHWLSVPCGRPGRPMRFSDSAIELCLTLKTLTVKLCGRPSPNGLHLAIHLHVHLIEMPTPMARPAHLESTLPTDVAGEQRAEPVPPEPHRLMADVDSKPPLAAALRDPI